MKSRGRMVPPPFASTWDADAPATMKWAISIARQHALIFLVPEDNMDIWCVLSLCFVHMDLMTDFDVYWKLDEHHAPKRCLGRK